MRFNSLISIVIKAVQELNVDVKELEHRVGEKDGFASALNDLLSSRVGRLEDRVRWLEESDRRRRGAEVETLSALSAAPPAKT